ncbi:MAG TPA: formyl transferase [Chitinophagaceae bacterium]|nr:formyl transferase [Chitinophagaceae bacterium]
MKQKIIILARDCDSTNIVYNYLKKYFEIDAIVFEKPIPRKKQLLNRAKRLGYMNAISQGIFFLCIAPLIRIFSQKRKTEIFKQYHLDETTPPENLVKRIRYVNTEEGRTLLNQLNPDLIIVNGTRIISKKTLESIHSTFINIHTGITPAFRGVHGGYWAVATGKKGLFGTTVHYVDAGVDTGGIIEQVFIEPPKKDNFYTYPYLQYASVLPVLKQVIQSFSEGNKPKTKAPVTTDSELWFHPTMFQWVKNIGKTFIFLFLSSFIQLF